MNLDLGIPRGAAAPNLPAPKAVQVGAQIPFGVSDSTCQWSGVFTLRADTDPLASGPLAAPFVCAGSKHYLAAIRYRYRRNLAARQQLLVLARRLGGDTRHPSLSVTGPYAVEARSVLEALRSGRAGR